MQVTLHPGIIESITRGSQLATQPNDRTDTMKTLNADTLGGTLEIHIHENRHERELMTWLDITARERGDVEYVMHGLSADECADAGTDYRFFRYLGAIYDVREFEVAPAWVQALGYDGWMTDSAFSATVINVFGKFGEVREGVVVGRIHW